MRLKLLSASILIAFALLLCTGRNAISEPGGKRNISKAERDDRQLAASGSPIAAPVHQRSQKQTDSHTSSETNNYSGTFKSDAQANPPEGFWRTAGDIATVVSAIFVAVFTGLLWHVSKQQKRLAGKTEETTRRSVEVARLAYVANSPSVFADDFVLKNFTTTERLPDDTTGLIFMVANFKLRNVGKGPAVIRMAKAKLKILPNEPKNWQLLPNPSDDWGDLSDCVPIPLSARVIPADGSIIATTGFSGLPSEEDYKAVKMTYDKHIIVYGSLEYTDASGEKYDLGFGVTYRPQGMLNDEFFSTGPAKYNRLR
jgi:hypothetical protein